MSANHISRIRFYRGGKIARLRDRCQFFFALAALMMVGIFCSAPAFAAGLFENAEYRLGRGLRLPAIDLTLSGYSSLRAQNFAGRPAALDLRDLSLFTIWEPGRWQFFAEIELENVFGIDDRGIHASDSELEIERLYLDYAFRDALNLRVGRYLTPFGRWNQLHADPLVWTVSRPIVTLLAIPDHGSGVAVHGERAISNNALEYHFYADDSSDLDPHHGESSFEDLIVEGIANDFDNALGGQLRYHFFDDRAEVALSFATIAVARSHGRRHLLGLDLLYRWHRVEFSMESAYRFSDDSREGDEWGVFMQGVLPLVGHCFFVVRSEFYSGGTRVDDAARGTFGVAYRPHPATTFKLEYHDGSNKKLTPDGVEASWSVLF